MKPVRGTTSPWGGFLLLKCCIFGGKGGCSDGDVPHCQIPLCYQGQQRPRSWPQGQGQGHSRKKANNKAKNNHAEMSGLERLLQGHTAKAKDFGSRTNITGIRKQHTVWILGQTHVGITVIFSVPPFSTITSSSMSQNDDDSTEVFDSYATFLYLCQTLSS